MIPQAESLQPAFAFDRLVQRTVESVLSVLMPLGCGVVKSFPGSDSVSLTFDDGPDPKVTPKLLATLDACKVTATFFCIGEQAARYPDLVREIERAGHEIGNHTMSHLRLYWTSPRRMMDDILRCQNVLQSLCKRPVTLFRAPYGQFRADLRYVARFGLTHFIKWDVATPWYETDPAALSAHVLARAKPGSIVLLHERLFGQTEAMSRAHVAANVASIPTMVQGLRARGLRFKSIGQQLAAG